MHVTDLAINKLLGMQLTLPSEGHIPEMPESPLLLNHVGTVHASVQFALLIPCRVHKRGLFPIFAHRKNDPHAI